MQIKTIFLSTALIVATGYFFIWLPNVSYNKLSLRPCEESDYLMNEGFEAQIPPSDDVCNSDPVTECPQKLYVVLAFIKLGIGLFLLKNFCICITPVFTHALEWKWPFLCESSSVCGDYNFIDACVILPILVCA